MIPSVVTLGQLLRAAGRSLEDPDLRALLFLLALTLLRGPTSYRRTEKRPPGSFYFGAVALATVGYGDLSPSTAAGKPFAVVRPSVGIVLGFVDAVAERSPEGHAEARRGPGLRPAAPVAAGRAGMFSHTVAPAVLEDTTGRRADSTASSGRSWGAEKARKPGRRLRREHKGVQVREAKTEDRRLGVAIVGLGGAVATTAVAGIELIKLGLAGTDGLPLADAAAARNGSSGPPPGFGELAPYEGLVFGGWDLSGDDLASAAAAHGVLGGEHLKAVKPALAGTRPWPAVANTEFCRNAEGQNCVPVEGLRAQSEAIRADLRRFREENDLDAVVLVNLASTERRVDPTLPVFATAGAFEKGLDEDAPEIGPAMVYAYAAVCEEVPYTNFTPSVAADVPALVELAELKGVPLSGKDGKTGQTMLKTVLAPALRSRALRVEGWFSANILGNGDGKVLDHPDSLASKVDTKGSVLDDLLGYEVENHVVTINYYPPRGDNKEAWDNVDLVGFLGQKMQLKVNFLCGDSVLAAPLVIELARLGDLAKRRGSGGAQEQFGLFFKAPMMGSPDERPEHALHLQEERLLAWIGDPVASGHTGGRPGGRPKAS